jgi:hypothetical protein
MDQRLFLFIWITATLEISNLVNETLGISAELKITSHAINIVIQNLSFLAWSKLHFEDSELDNFSHAANG